MCKVNDVINSRIMELLEQGTIPWRKTWNAGSNYPKNISGREYRGINVFMLACQEYSSPYWLTYKQATDKGGHVIKGSKSTPVCSGSGQFVREEEPCTITRQHAYQFNSSNITQLTKPYSYLSQHPKPVHRAYMQAEQLLLRLINLTKNHDRTTRASRLYFFV